MPQKKENFEYISSYTFQGQEHSVEHNKDALKEICLALALADLPRFERIAKEIRYRDKRWFADTAEGMFTPYLVPTTTLYLDTNLKTKDVKKIAHDLVEAFGLPRSTLSFSSREVRRE